MLVMAGSGEYLPRMEVVDRYLLERLPQPARVVCLPTAAGTEGPERIGYWSELGRRHFQRLGVQAEALPVIDQRSANDPALAEQIAAANFVYLSGGRPHYLYSVLENSLAWQAILQVQQTGGVVAGCSAGAMIMGEGFPGFPRWQKAFGLLPKAVVIPHFDEISARWLSGMRRLVARGHTLIGIDGFTVLLQEGATYSVLGQGGVTVLSKQGDQHYQTGQQVHWAIEN